MRTGAHTPEELESLLEDAFVTCDANAVGEMFEEGAVLVAAEGGREARGSEDIARLARKLLRADRTYVAEPRRVVQARDTALVLASGSLSVVRRGDDGGWRYAIALLSPVRTTQEEER